MTTTNIIVVEGVALPDPTSMTPSDYDLSDSERNAKGKMVAQIIREDIHKLELKWSWLTPDDYALIRRAVKKKFNLNVVFFSPDIGTPANYSMYVGDRKTPVYTYRDGKPVYKDVTLNLIEM
jgi:hypothetical protein